MAPLVILHACNNTSKRTFAAKKTAMYSVVLLNVQVCKGGSMGILMYQKQQRERLPTVCLAIPTVTR